jgi:hypothetical protein
MKNFTNKKTSLNTKIDLSNQKTEPFEAITPKHVSVVDDNATRFEKMLRSEKKEIMGDKDKIYIAINEDEYTHTTGTIRQIEEWIDENGYDPERQCISIFELKSERQLTFQIKRTTSIKLI